MSRAYAPRVVTANLLLSGEVVYFTEDDLWSPHHCEAELLTDEAVAEMRLLQASAQADLVVGPYLAEARPGPHGPEPVHIRERLRTRGPGNYFHGKQEAARR